MYSIDLVGSDLVIKNTKNPRVNNQFVVATIPQSSNDLTWAFTEDEKRVKLIANGVALTTTLFSEVKVSGVPCTSKADFISKMSVLSDFAGPVSAPSPYKVYTALLTQSGGDDLVYINYDDDPRPPLVIGTTYTIGDNSGGLDFTNIGAPNNEIGTSFVATGTEPNSWGFGYIAYNSGAPVVTVLENTIGNIYFTYDGLGYYFVLTQPEELFTGNKTVAFIGSAGDDAAAPAGGYLRITNTDRLIILTQDSSGADSNGMLLNTPIEIRVYN
jgi:hypothetical protein